MTDNGENQNIAYIPTIPESTIEKTMYTIAVNDLNEQDFYGWFGKNALDYAKEYRKNNPNQVSQAVVDTLNTWMARYCQSHLCAKSQNVNNSVIIN